MNRRIASVIVLGLIILISSVVYFKIGGRGGEPGRGHGPSSTEPADQNGSKANDLQPDGSKERHQGSDVGVGMDELSPEERKRVLAAMDSFKNYLKVLEFNTARLLGERQIEGATVWLYELPPPTASTYKEAEREIDGVAGDLRLNLKERRAFAEYAPRALASFLTKAGEKRGIFIEIPNDESHSITITSFDQNVDFEKMTAEFNAPEAMRFSFSEGTVRTIERDRIADSRYKAFFGSLDKNQDDH